MRITYQDKSDDCSAIVVGTLGTMKFVPHPSMAKLERNGNTMHLTSTECLTISKKADKEKLTAAEKVTLKELTNRVKKDKHFLS